MLDPVRSRSARESVVYDMSDVIDKYFFLVTEHFRNNPEIEGRDSDGKIVPSDYRKRLVNCIDSFDEMLVLLINFSMVLQLTIVISHADLLSFCLIHVPSLLFSQGVDSRRS